MRRCRAAVIFFAFAGLATPVEAAAVTALYARLCSQYGPSSGMPFLMIVRVPERLASTKPTTPAKVSPGRSLIWAMGWVAK